MKDSEAKLWNKLREGDKGAFDDIFYKYVKILFNYGKRYTINEEIVEDCIQDLFTDLWDKRKKLGETNQIKPYLFIALKRRILRKISKEKKILKTDQINDFFLEYSTEEKTNQEAGNAEIISQLNATLKKLTPKQKEVIYLKFYEQLSYVEIAEHMGVEVKAIYKLMARAISSLRVDFIKSFLFF